MSQEIDVETLTGWLAQGKPVTVLDVRPAHEHGAWWIPGSRHVDAYDALKAGSLGPLLDESLPTDRPVVTVCNLGRASMKAAELLSEQRGIPALTLRGGMKAWSVAWNTASCSFGPLEITQVRRTGKGCLSYLIRAEGEAVVIDASVDPKVYVSLANRDGADIRYVLDTHIHADHLSRSRRLAGMSGAELMLSRQNRVSFPHKSIAGGDRLPLGSTWIEVLATPGHTDESVTYLIPHVGLFSGDTLFLNGVGRPDLHASREEMEIRARLLFKSLGQLTSLDPRLLVFPGHTSAPVSFNERVLTAPLGEVRSRLGSWLSSEEEFVNRVLARIPETPPNYAAITGINESGDWPESDPTDLEAGANRCAIS